jgi:hypothetical protein
MEKSKKHLLIQKQKLISQLSEYPDIVSGSFFERSLNGKKRLYISRMIKGVQRQVYISEKQKRSLQAAISQYEQFQKIVIQVCEINLKLIKSQKE